jgi:hypothetical protein
VDVHALGYQASHNLLVRHINQGRVDGDRPPTLPRRLAGLLPTHPDHLTDKQRSLRDELSAACPEMIDLAALVASFADLLDPRSGGDCGSRRDRPSSSRVRPDGQSSISAVDLGVMNFLYRVSFQGCRWRGAGRLLSGPRLMAWPA